MAIPVLVWEIIAKGTGIRNLSSDWKHIPCCVSSRFWFSSWLETGMISDCFEFLLVLVQTKIDHFFLVNWVESTWLLDSCGLLSSNQNWAYVLQYEPFLGYWALCFLKRSSALMCMLRMLNWSIGHDGSSLLMIMFDVIVAVVNADWFTNILRVHVQM